MTYKAAICDLPYGGGKSVILGDPRRAKTPALLRAMGRAVEQLGGRYIVADDIGTTLDDLAVMRAATSHTAAATRRGARAAGGHRLWRADGDPGGGPPRKRPRRARRPAGRDPGARQCRPAARRLSARGGRAADGRRSRSGAGRGGRAGASARGWSRPAAIHRQPVDLFAPCALGAVLDDRTIAELQARIVCGGANNQLAEAAPRRAAGRARHPLRAGLPRQCRRRDRLPPGADRRFRRRRAGRGRPDRGDRRPGPARRRALGPDPAGGRRRDGAGAAPGGPRAPRAGRLADARPDLRRLRAAANHSTNGCGRRGRGARTDGGRRSEHRAAEGRRRQDHARDPARHRLADRGPAGRDARHRSAGEPVQLVQPAPPAAGRRRGRPAWCRACRAGGSAASSAGCGASSIWCWSTPRPMPRPMPAARSRAADLALLPCQPNALDLWASKATLDLAEAVGTEALLVLNRVPARSRAAEAIRAEIAAERWPLAAASLGNRQAFAASIGDRAGGRRERARQRGGPGDQGAGGGGRGPARLNCERRPICYKGGPAQPGNQARRRAWTPTRDADPAAISASRRAASSAAC